MDADGLNDLESTPDFQLVPCDAEAQLAVKAAPRAVVTPRREVVLTKRYTIRTSPPCTISSKLALSGLLTGPPRGPNWGVVHRARPTPPPLVLMCYFRLDNIPKRAGTVCKAIGRARCTIPQFGPLGGPASRPERANFEDRVRSRK